MDIKKLWKEWILPLGLEVLGLYLFIKLVAFAVFVPSGSMLPTIEVPSVLIATRVYLPEKTVERGDIIAFESDELDKILIKRCIGLPGEKIVLDKEGRLFINDVYFEEPYVVYESEESGVWVVPDGCYFFLGDNRAGSYDAREWDEPFIPEDRIIGEARFTVYPFGNLGFLN